MQHEQRGKGHGTGAYVDDTDRLVPGFQLGQTGQHGTPQRRHGGDGFGRAVHARHAVAPLGQPAARRGVDERDAPERELRAVAGQRAARIPSAMASGETVTCD